VVRHRHRLPTALVDAPSWDVFKRGLGGTLSNVVWWKVSPPVIGVLELDGL